MRVGTALFAGAAGCVLVDALNQETVGLMTDNDTHRGLMAAEQLSPGVCYWGQGLSCDLSEATNNLKLGSEDCIVPIPIPTDNYVSDLRKNKYDDIAKKVASQQPFVQLTSTLRASAMTTTKKTAWHQYVTNPTLVQNEIGFDAPGMYDMSIIANDYNGEVTCMGCIAILDTFRPRYGTAGACPSPLTTPQTLTQTTLTAFQNHDNAYRSYTSDANVINNPNSGTLCGTPGTDRVTKRTLFYELEKDCSTTCFDDTTLATNVAKLKMTPFPTANSNLQSTYSALESTLNAQCSWCCKKTKTLKEMYTPYTCPTDYDPDSEIPMASCEIGAGIPNTCSINVCLQAKGIDIITASLAIKSTVQTTSKNTLNALPTKPAGSDATANVYYSIPCTTFDRTDTNCRYTVKLSQLLDVTRGFNSVFPVPSTEATKSKDYVFWRYNTDGTTFVKWDPISDSAIAFTESSTTVVIEAWTACGRAYQTSFTVNLFVHSTLTCSKFDAMWTVVEKPGIEGSEGTYCAYGGSDFSILKLNMAATDILNQIDSTVTGTYTGMQCDIMVKETGGSDKQVVTFVDDSTSTTLNKYFGVELVNTPTTAQKTTGKIHCTFTRTPRTNTLMLADAVATTNTNSISCDHTFTITDCDKPELIIANKNDVCADKCAGNAAPGVFEACGGSVVTSSATNTILNPSAAQTCCTACTQTLTCNSVGVTDVKRCEPPPSLFLAELAAAEEPSNLVDLTTMALLGASAMVAIVALVVVKRHVSAAAHAQVEEDVYYPLLE